MPLSTNIIYPFLSSTACLGNYFQNITYIFLAQQSTSKTDLVKLHIINLFSKILKNNFLKIKLKLQ